MKKILISLFLFLALGIMAAIAFLPWNTILESRIAAFMEQQSMGNIAVTVDRIGFHEATFNNIRIGEPDPNPLLLQSVTIQYSPLELLNQNLQDLTLTGLDIRLDQTDQGWKIAGMPPPKSENAAPQATQTLSDIIDLLPFTAITVKDSHFTITGESLETRLPFNLHLTKSPETKLDMTIDATNLTAASSDISLGTVTVTATPDENRNWNGIWTAESIDFGKALPVPVLQGNGALNYTGNAVTIEGQINSENKDYRTEFLLLLDIIAPDKNMLTIISANLPFKGGRVSTQNASIPFDRSQNIRINLNAQKVSLDELLQTLTGQRVTATGTVTGSIPVILHPDGSYTLGKGNLKADQKGLIKMSGDAIPGDNEQVQLVRQILENLHYTAFNASVDTTNEDGMVVKLSLEGNNPDVYDGRIVKLNVNLTGDLLDFIQQNATLITNPEKLLRQEAYE
jgi:hypothetical protein